MKSVLRSIIKKVKGLTSKPPEKLNRDKLMGMYLTTNNGKGQGSLTAENKERRNGRFSQNRQRV